MDEALLAQLRRRQPRTILLLGASDTGKTTLLEQLLTQWREALPAVVVDCDVGQSRLGPPTTVGWGLVSAPFAGWSRVVVRGMAFTGTVSPEGNVETFLCAVSQMVQAARQAAPRLFIDTTGLMAGELGRTVKTRKVQAVTPDLLIAIQRDRELEELLATLTHIPIERLSVSPTCGRRSTSERDAYRDLQLARYFADSVTHVLSPERVTLVGIGPDWSPHLSIQATASPGYEARSHIGIGPSDHREVGGWPTGHVTRSPAALLDRIVGLRDDEGRDLALGLLREVDHEHQTLTVLTPLRDLSAIRTLAVGSLHWPVAR